jgi:hypothetical protein
MTTTTLHLGQVPGRVRRAFACARPAAGIGTWRPGTTMPAFGGFRATGLAVGNGYGDAARFVESISTTAVHPTTKRPARHLGTRST